MVLESVVFGIRGANLPPQGVRKLASYPVLRHETQTGISSARSISLCGGARALPLSVRRCELAFLVLRHNFLISSCPFDILRLRLF